MLPFIELSVLGNHVVLSTGTFLLVLALVCSIALLSHSVAGASRCWKAPLLVFGVGLFALVGGRLLHVFWEHPALLKTPELIFSRWDGSVFYGGLGAGFVGMVLFSRILFSGQKHPEIWAKIWDGAAIATAMSYGILRLGCFAKGCCWGKMTGLPWAIRYLSRASVMPVLGIPVHPVQLYDSFLGFLIAGTLFVLRRMGRFKGQLFPVFITLFSFSRFITEQFRGDSIRGVNVWLGLSTSQIISVALFITGIVSLFRFAPRFAPRFALKVARSKIVRVVAVLAATAGLSGCMLPTPPGNELFSESQVIRPGLIHYRSYDYEKKTMIHPKRRGNVLFLTADSYMYKLISGQISNYFEKGDGTTGSTLPSSTPSSTNDQQLSIEELAWWEYAPILTDIYDHIIRITLKEAKHKTVLQALEELEAFDQPYDVFILSHGFPNHLSSGDGYFLSYRELEEYRSTHPKSKHMNVLFMQSCFGSSLVEDWNKVGAKAVLSFPGFNRNFFFISFFLGYLRDLELKDAYQTTIDNMEANLTNSPLYRKLLEILGITVEQYLKASPNPDLLIM